jgi:hypothetical protein
MADAQDLKMLKWPFLVVSSGRFSREISPVFTGRNSLFACLCLVKSMCHFSPPKVAQKVAQEKLQKPTKTKNCIGLSPVAVRVFKSFKSVF